MLHFKAKMHQI